MRRNAIVTVAVVIALLVLASQVAIPAYVSSEVEDRLTAGGGTAHVEVHALPALQLARGDGERIRIRGSDLRFDFPPQDSQVFDRLDGFEEVDAELSRVATGPFAIQRFTLTRGKDEGTYRLVMEASSTGGELAQYAGDSLGGTFGGLMGRFAGGLLPFDDEPVPVAIDAQVRSVDGRAEVVRASGDVLGLPAGPIAAALAAAVAGRL